MNNSAAPVRSVYVHVPFCARQCGYCDFAIAVGRTVDEDGWITAIEAEWLNRTALDSTHSAAAIDVAQSLETVYVGGGTPSMLGPDAMHRLRGVLELRSRCDALEEWTVESNPESSNAELFAAWRRAGVTRVSVGIQSFHDATLRWMGRSHGPEGARQAMRLAVRAGFMSITADLIFGVPADLGRSWSSDIDALLEHDPPHISLYGLTIEPDTPFARAVESGRITPVDEGQYEEEYLYAAERLVAEGYEHYEVSSFARPGHRAVHNARYWAGTAYAGLGNGAHSFAPPLRSWNVRAWPEYRRRTEGKLPTMEESERVEGSRSELERLWLGLRHDVGVPASVIGAETVSDWTKRGLAETSDGWVKMTPAGWLILDQLVVDVSTERETSSSGQAPGPPRGSGTPTGPTA